MEVIFIHGSSALLCKYFDNAVNYFAVFDIIFSLSQLNRAVVGSEERNSEAQPRSAARLPDVHWLGLICYHTVIDCCHVWFCVEN